MGELLDAISSRFIRETNDSDRQMHKVKIMNRILDLCNEYLTSPGAYLDFEVAENDLTAAIEAISDPGLTSRYVIEQLSEKIFRARAAEVELL